MFIGFLEYIISQIVLKPGYIPGDYVGANELFSEEGPHSQWATYQVQNGIIFTRGCFFSFCCLFCFLREGKKVCECSHGISMLSYFHADLRAKLDEPFLCLGSMLSQLFFSRALLLVLLP